MAAICLLAAAGGALAMKARVTTYWIKTAANAYTTATALDPCPGGDNACTTFTFGKDYTLYVLDPSKPLPYITQFQP